MLMVRRSDMKMRVAARDVQVGDLVWDGSSFTAVLLSAPNPASGLVIVKLSSGAELAATGNHIMLRADGSEVPLERVLVGDALLTDDGSDVHVSGVGATAGRSVELNTSSSRICVDRVIVSDSTRSAERKALLVESCNY